MHAALHFVVAVVLMMSSGLALAQDKPRKAEPTAKKATTPPPAAIDLTVTSKKRTPPASGADATIDLFPQTVLANQGKKGEEQRGFSLGDDRDWKVQAAQVGVMAAGFAALVGLCNGGKCKLPGAVGSIVPDWLKSEAVAPGNPRRPQTLRSVR